MALIKMFFKLLALPLILAVTIIQWVGIFFTSFSAIIFNLLAGLIFLITVIGFVFGVELPGWKLVEGRSVRKITDQDGAAAALNKAGYKTAEIYKPQELKTITELEKLAGKKQFAAICGEYIEKPRGKPTLAPESDKRAAINPMLDDFKNIE